MENKGFDISNYGTKQKPNYFIHYNKFNDLFTVIDNKICYYSGIENLNMIDEINTEQDVETAIKILLSNE